ncbi:PREDICTED: zinc finger protein 62 homolog [Nicrophorus vespilloides]|uniref:Zinc finger protein 62 homolog n=1 Tax=Nicrophorus vespilloides TaxID=110193 RepID=A0ABM1NHJ5_NICVS|nr:PREDICTED: zinc finger protein 62 homolog [Nicrophorus vespilloides]
MVSIKEDRLVDGGGRPTCDICNKGCKNQRTLREHMKIHNNTYNCEQCDRMFKKVLDYILHMTSHSADGKFQCVNCDYATGEMMDITKHLLARHEKTWKYTCGICKKGFNIFSWFKEHQNFHTGQKPFACSYCEKTFMYSRHLAAHKHIVHKDRTDGDVHECLLCKKQYQHRNSLKLHMNNTHAGNVSVCEVCGKQLSSKEKLKFHMRIHTGYKPFKCSYCEKAFVKKPLLIEHERIHTGVKPYRCTYCEKCFSQRTSLVIHMRNHTGEKPYKCLICAKGFVSRAIMNLHLKSYCSEYVCRNAIDKEEQIIIVSNAELRYACSDCDQNFEGIVDFSLHVQNHLADSSKSFACPFCEFTTIFKRSFRNHVRLHAEEEFRYECEICSKKFINKLPYEEHMILHQGLDIYQCDCCPKRFVLERYLAIHKKLNHEQEKDAECEMCGRAFKFSNSLVRHMRSIHKIGTDTTKECPVCYKILSNPYNLKMHMRVHTGETPFICDVCGKGFTKNYKLKQHLNVHQK